MIYEQHQGFSIETNKRSKHYSMSEPHYHDAYEIYIPLSGKSTLMIGDEILCIEPDRVAVINALVPHGNFSKTEHERIVLYFDKLFLNNYLTHEAQNIYLSLFTAKVIQPSSVNFKRMQTYGRLLQQEYLEGKDASKIFLLLSELLILLKPSPPVKSVSPHEIEGILGAVLLYIILNFKSINSVTELAERFFVSKSYICRIFKKGTGLTITQYINSLKINEACNLLKDTDMDITKICYDVGYNSYTHFFSNFTKIIGETPYTYRKNNFDMSNQEEAQKRISGSSRSYRDKSVGFANIKHHS